MTIDLELDHSHPVGVGTLLFGMLGGVLSWGVHLGASYPLVAPVCAMGGVWLLHAITVVTASVCLLAAFVAWRAWQRLRDYEPERGKRAVRRMRFMALFGIFSGLFFFLVTVAEGLPVFLIDPCVSVT